MQVLVVGFARSGAAVAQLLVQEGHTVVVSDPSLSLEQPDATMQALQAAGVTFTTAQTEAELVGVDLVVKNPGIPYRIPVLQAAAAQGLPIVVEVAVAQPAITGPWIALTGSNGKTTTTKMVDAVLSTVADATHPVLVAGNIGTPVSELVPKLTPTTTLITELSSFQLMGTPDLKPNIAIITNIFASHLDYHGSREAYIEAKLQITANQTADDYLILNADQPEWTTLAAASAAQIVPVSRLGHTRNGAYQQDGWLYFRDEAIMPAQAVGVPGDHNVENALVAIAVGRLQGVPVADIKAALSAFGGVAHRLQKVGYFAERLVYNDSKATDIEATESALSGFEQPVVLLAGGLDRGDDLSRLIPSLEAHVKALVVFGETADQLVAVAEQAGLPVVKTQDVTTAVPEAFALSAPDDVILLSPAAASWDQFKNFEVRGDAFVEAVNAYVATESTK